MGKHKVWIYETTKGYVGKISFSQPLSKFEVEKELGKGGCSIEEFYSALIPSKSEVQNDTERLTIYYINAVS